MLRSFRYLPGLLFGLLILSAAAGTDTPPCAAESTDYLGGRAVRLTNGLVEALVAPELGGRVIRAAMAGHSFLHAGDGPKDSESRETELKTDFGGDWAGAVPQDERAQAGPAPDNMRFVWEIIEKGPEKASVRMDGPVGSPLPGLQLTRTITVTRGSSKIVSHSVLTNRGSRRAVWSLKESARFDATAPGPQGFSDVLLAYAPASPEDAFPKGYAFLYGEAGSGAARVLKRAGLFRLRFGYRAGKWALAPAVGWLAVAHRQRQAIFTQLFEPSPRGAYPGKASATVRVNGAGRFAEGGKDIEIDEDLARTPPYLETEIFSPYTGLGPGESLAFTVVWGLTKGSSYIVRAGPAGVVHMPLAVWPSAHRVTVTGIFGSFYAGSARLVFENDAGFRLGTQDLGTVTPMQARAVSASASPPAGTARISVEALDDSGSAVGILDSAPLPPSPAPPSEQP
ncbi:MAG: hypothetical protein IT210_07230 [Armatimonadetes bacterium]|nr:hypothetical protein [Armatimonadota bacterium]